MSEAYQANHNLDFVRLLEEASTKEAALVVNATGSTFDPSRKTSSTDTKTGTISSIGSMSVKDDLDAVDCKSEANDDLEQSLYANKEIERWHVNLDRQNDDGKYYAVYERGYVTEISQTGNAGNNVTKKYTFTINYGPVRGWLSFNKSQAQELNFVFKDLKVEGTGDGVAFDFSKDRTTDTPKDTAKADAGGSGTSHS